MTVAEGALPEHRNVLVLLADEHSPRFMGCSGHPLVQTPHLDALAARGARFTNAYTPSPICVPARASLATGRWVHELGTWGSAEPYRGDVPGWAHIARDAGHRTTSIGKLHFGSVEDDHGFAEELVPMHVINGVGWVQGLDRRPEARYPEAYELAADVGVGESTYVGYDRVIGETAVDWIRSNAANGPWVLFVSFVSPHYPLTAPKEWWDRYADVTDPEIAAVEETHPNVRAVASYFNYHDSFDPQTVLDGRRAYFALCSFVDDQIGRVLNALDQAGAAASTHVIYTSDHGDMAGNRGLWCKSHMYEDSAGVPMIVAGPRIAPATVCATPVNLVDVHNTVLDMAGLEQTGAPGVAGGVSLIDVLAEGDDTAAATRSTFSEYHDGGAPAGFFMVRRGRWKYVHHVGTRPQLFDLDADPDELHDLGTSPDHAAVRAGLDETLRTWVDPDTANTRAFADQATLLAALGGADGIASAVRFNHTPVPGAHTPVPGAHTPVPGAHTPVPGQRVAPTTPARPSE